MLGLEDTAVNHEKESLLLWSLFHSFFIESKMPEMGMPGPQGRYIFRLCSGIFK